MLFFCGNYLPRVGVEFGGPREPWHDLHCKVDGPAAYDVLTNFEQRWQKTAKRHGIGKLKRWNDDSLLKLERLPDMIGLSQLNILDENDPETWHVQVFRSIDSSSVKGFPKDAREAETMNLVCGKNVVIDMSIHTAYVKAIRSAQHFIYIENQYFIGSSYNWASHKDIESPLDEVENLVMSPQPVLASLLGGLPEIWLCHLIDLGGRQCFIDLGVCCLMDLEGQYCREMAGNRRLNDQSRGLEMEKAKTQKCSKLAVKGVRISQKFKKVGSEEDATPGAIYQRNPMELEWQRANMPGKNL
eukprot:Gb_35650 [translate_table: standard]